ncbi:MAG TPA: sulfotransferase [Flavobacteriaceae bacterium]|nr:sulfotransferase [Flavobacteriaceae bacterium]
MPIPIEMVFVVCSGRSGSTLLQSMFDAHPNICAPIESKFVLHLVGKYGENQNWDEETISSYCTDLYSNRKFRLFWKIQKNTLLKAFSNYSVKSFEDACKVVYLSFPSFFNKGKIQIIVDKNPLHIRFMDKLSTIFPNAKFIHLIRDPRAVYNSRREAFNEKSAFLHANRWNLENSLALNFQKENPQKYYRMFYEKLILNPEETLKGTTDFMNVSFNENMLSGHKRFKERIAENKYLNLVHHRNIAKPVMSENIEKWRIEVDPKNIRIIEAITFDLAYSLRYFKEKPQLSVFEGWKNKMGNAQLHLRYSFFNILFDLPFFWRRNMYNFVSLFFDRKYKEVEKN